MRLSGLILAAGLVAPSLGLTVRVQAGDITEDSGTATARFLQGLADYKPAAFHQFIKQLVDNKWKPSRVELSDPRFQPRKGLDGRDVKTPYTDGSLNPLFTRFVQPNETTALLEAQVHRYRHVAERTELELLRFAVASGQADEIVDIMDGVWRRRESEIAESSSSSRTCNSWIDVRGTKACTSAQFWHAVGLSEKRAKGVINIKADGADIAPYPMDTLLPDTRNDSLPFVVLYATPMDEEFPLLYDLLYSLAAPASGSPRLQFAIRWKSDSKSQGKKVPKSLPQFSAKLDVKEGSVSALSESDVAQLGLRATAHIVASEDPLATFASVAAHVPVLASELSTSVPEKLSAAVKAHALEPSFTINGVAIPFEDVNAQALVRHLRAERPIIYSIQKLHPALPHKNAREMISAYGFSSAEEITGQNEKNLVKPSPSNPLKFVNLVTALKDLPSEFAHHSYLDGVDPDQVEPDTAERVDPPSYTTTYVIADLDSPKGRKLVQEALKYLDTRAGLRVSFVHNPTEHSLPEHAYHLSTLLHSLIAGGEFKEVFPAELSAWLTAAIGKDGPKKPLDDIWNAENPITPFVEGATPEQQQAALAFWQAVSPFVDRAGVKAGESALIINGRVVNLKSGPFLSSNFRAIHEYELEKRIQPIVNAMQNLPENLARDRDTIARVAAAATSIIGGMSLPVGTTIRSRPYAALPADYPSFTAGLTEANSMFEVGVVVDPVSELAQQWAPVLKALSSLPNVFIRVYLAPSPHTVPASSLYSASVRSKLDFDHKQQLVKPHVTFDKIPADAIVSLSVTVNDWGLIRPLNGKDVKEMRGAELPAEAVYEFKQSPLPDDEDEEASPVEVAPPVPAESPRVKDEL